jgi:D-hydroxyproline dehydrogenase subunit beta
MSSRRCVVIGAGILGASVAARLAGAGLRVTLLDQDQPGRATSRWSFAWLNSNDKAPRHYHDLNHAGIKAWAELAPDLDGDAWYRPVGHVELADPSDSGSAELAARVSRLTEWGYPARIIDPPEAARLEPALRIPAPGAFFPREGYLLTEPLIARLVAQAQSHGAEVLTGQSGQVTRLEPGGVPRVRTATGVVLEADEVICCAGRWTPDLAAVPLIPWRIPGSTAPGLTVRVGPVAPPGPVRLVHTPDLALRPHPGGLLHLEAPDAAVDLHTPDAELDRWAEELLRRARQAVRGLDDARVVERKVCARPMPADGQSIVGRLPGTPGIYVAVTHSGVTLAAHLSRLITEDLTADPPAAGLTPYRPTRFASLPGGLEQHWLGAHQVRLARDRRILVAGDEPVRQDHRAVRHDVRVAEVHVAPDDRMPVIGAAVLDAGHVLDAEMLSTQFQAERPVRGPDGIADARDQRHAKVRAACTGVVGDRDHATRRGQQHRPEQREPCLFQPGSSISTRYPSGSTQKKRLPPQGGWWIPARNGTSRPASSVWAASASSTSRTRTTLALDRSAGADISTPGRSGAGWSCSAREMRAPAAASVA